MLQVKKKLRRKETLDKEGWKKEEEHGEWKEAKCRTTRKGKEM